MITAQNKNPVHPGKILTELYLEPLGLNITGLAEKLGSTRASISEIIHGKRGISSAMALKLGDAFETGPELWLNLQLAYDLHQARKKHRKIPPVLKVS